VAAVELLQLRAGTVANSNDKMLGFIWLQATVEDKQPLGICINTLYLAVT